MNELVPKAGLLKARHRGRIVSRRPQQREYRLALLISPDPFQNLLFVTATLRRLSIKNAVPLISYRLVTGTGLKLLASNGRRNAVPIFLIYRPRNNPDNTG